MVHRLALLFLLPPIVLPLPSFLLGLLEDGGESDGENRNRTIQEKGQNPDRDEHESEQTEKRQPDPLQKTIKKLTKEMNSQYLSDAIGIGFPWLISI